MNCLSSFVALAIIASVACFETRIIGGDVTSINYFPYQVSIQAYGQHTCGGAIINERQVLTAAHCTYGINPFELKVRAGSSLHKVGGQLVQVSRVSHHNAFNRLTHDNDLAVLTVKEDLQFTLAVRSIRKATTLVESGTAVVSGWGTRTPGGLHALALESVNIPIIPRDECEQLLPNQVTENMICAGDVSGQKGTCQGDSGNPLVMDGELIGIASWGTNCGQRNLPGVYTNVVKVSI